MGIEITFGELHGSLEPLKLIGQQNGLEPQVKMRVMKVMKAYNVAYTELMKRQKALQDEAQKKWPAPTTPPAGPASQAQAEIDNQERMKFFNVESDKLFDEKITVDCKPLFASIFGPYLPVAGHLLMLDWLIVDDISPNENSDKPN